MTAERTWTHSDLPESVQIALEAALSAKARIPVVIRATEVTGYTDWVMLLSGRSDRNVRAIVDAIRDALAKHRTSPIGTDGVEAGQWALLDFDDFMIHVFYHPIREHFDLGSMWSDAPRVQLEVPADAFDTSDLQALQLPDVLPEFRGDIGEFGGFDDEFKDYGDDEWDDGESDDDDSEDSDDSAAGSDKKANDAAAASDDDLEDDDWNDSWDDEEDRGSEPEDGDADLPAPAAAPAAASGAKRVAVTEDEDDSDDDLFREED